MRNLEEVMALKKWQDEFCAAANIYAYCVDEEGQPITEMSGNEADRLLLKEAASCEQIYNICKRVAIGSLEEQAVESTAVPNVWLAAVSSSEASGSRIAWVIYGVIEDTSGTEEGKTPDFKYVTTQKGFYLALDLLRDTTNAYLQLKNSMLNAEAESMRSRYSESEMGASLKRNAAITEIVQLLESDDEIEKIMTDVLQIAGAYLEIRDKTG